MRYLPPDVVTCIKHYIRCLPTDIVTISNIAQDAFLLTYWLCIKHNTRCWPPDIVTLYITQHDILTSWHSDCISNRAQYAYLLI